MQKEDIRAFSLTSLRTRTPVEKAVMSSDWRSAISWGKHSYRFHFSKLGFLELTTIPAFSKQPILHLTAFVTISSSLLLMGRAEFTLWTRHQLGAHAVWRKGSSQFWWILRFLLPHHILSHELLGGIPQLCFAIRQEEVQGCWILVFDKRVRNTCIDSPGG